MLRIAGLRTPKNSRPIVARGGGAVLDVPYSLHSKVESCSVCWPGSIFFVGGGALVGEKKKKIDFFCPFMLRFATFVRLWLCKCYDNTPTR